MSDIDRIKQMVEEGRITAEEAEQLIAVLREVDAAGERLAAAGAAATGRQESHPDGDELDDAAFDAAFDEAFEAEYMAAGAAAESQWTEVPQPENAAPAENDVPAESQASAGSQAPVETADPAPRPDAVEAGAGERTHLRAEEGTHRGADGPADHPADHAADGPADHRADHPADHPTDNPAERSADRPTDVIGSAAWEAARLAEQAARDAAEAAREVARQAREQAREAQHAAREAARAAAREAREAAREAMRAARDGAREAAREARRALKESARTSSDVARTVAQVGQPVPPADGSARPGKSVAPEGTRWVTIEMLGGDLHVKTVPGLTAPIVEGGPGELHIEDVPDGYRVRFEPDRGGFLEGLLGSLRSGDIRLSLPPDFGLVLEATAGDVNLSGVKYLCGRMRAGELNANSLEGVDFSMTAGDFNANVAPRPGRHVINVGAGDLHVNIAEGADVVVDGRVSIGDVSARVPGLERRSSGLGGTVAGVLGSGAARLEVRVTTGDLSVDMGRRR